MNERLHKVAYKRGVVPVIFLIFHHKWIVNKRSETCSKVTEGGESFEGEIRPCPEGRESGEGREI